MQRTLTRTIQILLFTNIAGTQGLLKLVLSAVHVSNRYGGVFIPTFVTSKDRLLLRREAGQCSAGENSEARRNGDARRGKKGKQAQCRKTCRAAQEVHSRKICRQCSASAPEQAESSTSCTSHHKINPLKLKNMPTGRR